MIAVPAALMIAILLLLFLLLLAIRGVFAAREVSSHPNVALPGDVPELSLCAAEFASRIFSHDDLEFVLATKSPRLKKLFDRERKEVALVWVRQTSAAIRQIMREHAVAARENKDLEFTTEARLLVLYVQLMVVCSVLFLVIQSTGPLWLRGLAMYADSLSQRIAWTQRAFGKGAMTHKIHGVGSI